MALAQLFDKFFGEKAREEEELKQTLLNGFYAVMVEDWVDELVRVTTTEGIEGISDEMMLIWENLNYEQQGYAFYYLLGTLAS
jgi:hypothetical protein